MSNIALWISGIGLLISFMGSLGAIFFKMGQHSARLDKIEEAAIKLDILEGHAVRITALEEWRGNLRKDMWEISEKLSHIGLELKKVHTLIEERTERRAFERTKEFRDN